MDFDQPLSLAEQSQITYAIQEGVTNAGNEVSLANVSSSEKRRKFYSQISCYIYFTNPHDQVVCVDASMKIS